MILLPNKSIIISYIPYVYKDGGFCILINSKNKIETSEVPLSNSDIKSLLKTKPITYKNRTPLYKDILSEYFFGTFK